MTTTTDSPVPRRRAIGLPLLAKELLEQSARKRTYVLRTVYACLLFFVGLMLFYQVVYDGLTNPLSVLGRGREVFEQLLVLQLAGIYLFMPAITCAVITTEKERKTLGLLFLTKLGPWTIVLEKYLGRCFTMLTFLMLCLPLMAFCYSLGGVNSQDIIVGSWMLFITTLQVGAFALMCSCLFRSTVGAFIGTYLFGFVFYLGPIILTSFLFWDSFSARNQGLNYVCETINAFFSGWLGRDLEVIPENEYLLFMWVPPLMLFDVGRWNTDITLTLIRSIPTLVSIGGFLCLARIFLVRQAFVPARNSVLHLFRKLDGLFSRMNENRVTKGIVLIRESTTLPEDEPIAWRETKKKSLGTVRYLVRVFVVLELPVLAICLMTVLIDAGQSWYQVPVQMSLMYFLVWLLAVLLVVVKATSLIAGERTHETLDVLLTTPLTTEEIVSQKLRGLWRLLFVVAVPLVTIILFETWWRTTVRAPVTINWANTGAGGNLLPMILGLAAGWFVWRQTDAAERWIRYAGLAAVLFFTLLIYGWWEALTYKRSDTENSTALYLVSSLLAVGIYLPLVAWLSMYIGLRLKTQARALFGSLAAIVGWCIGPLVLVIPLFVIFQPSDDNPILFFLLSGPGTIVPVTEFSDLDLFAELPWVAVVINFLGYGLALNLIRHKCLKAASRYLGRAEPFRMP